jgi:tetratricopeptide (TPR) repeat protein
MSNSKKEKRSRRNKNTRRNKKRTGGASGASRDSGTSASSTFHILDPKRGTKIKRIGFLGARGGPDSAMFGLLEERLLQPQQHQTSGPRHPHMTEKMHRATYRRVKTKKVENELFRRAERLHATSFRYRTHRDIATGDLQRCIAANMEAVEHLQKSLDMGNIRACARIADMLLNGNTVGVRKDIREAMRLVSHVDDPDCQGVLAHYHFNSGIKDGPGLAALSASAGSKYGQYVLGLYEKQKGNMKKAAEYFTLAAAQNYEEAQIALSEMQSDPDESLRLLNLAADQGNMNAFFLIANIYRRQSNDKPNTMAFHNAMYWYNLALKANHPYAFDAVSAMQQLMR